MTYQTEYKLYLITENLSKIFQLQTDRSHIYRFDNDQETK